MINGLLSGLLKFITGITFYLLSPLFALITDFMLQNNLDSVISSATNIFLTYVTPACGFFFQLIPPMTRNMIFIDIKLILAFYVFEFAYGTIMDLLSLIKKIPFV